MIEQFVAQSLGEWISMRSSHSLAFKQFEEVVSKIKIKPIDFNAPIIQESIQCSSFAAALPISPFSIEWSSETNWEIDNKDESLSGETILIPLKIPNDDDGIILRSSGYAEKIGAISRFDFLSDGTLNLNTQYSETYAEERIWFLSENVRCRSSVLRSKSSKAILQTSYASEIRILGS